jgi:hypothetical protein
MRNTSYSDQDVALALIVGLLLGWIVTTALLGTGP